MGVGLLCMLCNQQGALKVHKHQNFWLDVNNFPSKVIIHINKATHPLTESMKKSLIMNQKSNKCAHTDRHLCNCHVTCSSLLEEAELRVQHPHRRQLLRVKNLTNCKSFYTYTHIYGIYIRPSLLCHLYHPHIINKTSLLCSEHTNTLKCEGGSTGSIFQTTRFVLSHW